MLGCDHFCLFRYLFVLACPSVSAEKAPNDGDDLPVKPQVLLVSVDPRVRPVVSLVGLSLLRANTTEDELLHGILSLFG